jgi:hypothetical protein
MRSDEELAYDDPVEVEVGSPVASLQLSPSKTFSKDSLVTDEVYVISFKYCMMKRTHCRCFLDHW